jgi:CNT family concentrative nucleoside transporter
MLQGILGLAAIIGLAWLTSSDRRSFPTITVLIGIASQLVLAVAFLKLAPLQQALMLVNRAVLAIESATREGTGLVFGFLGGGPAPFDVAFPEYGFVLAFRSLPIVLVFAALSALLWHWRVIPVVVGAFARLLARALGLSGAVSVGTAASVFVGMVESPLLIKPYLRIMNRGELFILMTCGMATVAGTVMGLYAGLLANVIPGALSHILVASLVSAPAAVTLARIMIPSAGDSEAVAVTLESPYSGSMDAVVSGTGEGLKLLGNIIAMLVVLVALVYLVDAVLGLVVVGGQPLTLTGLASWVLQPLAWLIGVPWQEARAAGELLALKVFVNELVAYIRMAELDASVLSERSRIIMTYALCGFANLGSLGIMIGGLTALAPERRADILQLAPRSVWSGFLATCMTGALVGMLY